MTFFLRGGGVGWDLDYQGSGLLRDLPWEEDAGAIHSDDSGQVHCIRYGFFEESRIGGEDGDQDPVYEKGI